MRRVIVGLLFACVCASAQDQKPAPQSARAESKRHIDKVYEIKQGDPRAIAELLKILRSPGPDFFVGLNPTLRVISVSTTDPEFITQADEVVKRYDRPFTVQVDLTRRDVEVTVYILLANGKATATAPLPAALHGVAQELSRELGLSELRLLDTAVVRSREGKYARIAGAIEGVSPAAPEASSSYEMSYNESAIEGIEPGKRHVMFQTFQFNLQLQKDAKSQQALSYRTDLTLAEGQKGVLGKSKIGVGDASLVLVVMGRVLD